MNEYMKTAIDLSVKNLKTNAGGPFGAVVVKNGKIIGRGSNCVLKNNDPTAHAEMMAIRDACAKIKSFDLSGCELYTSCYPCPMCLSAIIWANIKTVYYGNTPQDAAKIGFRDKFIYDYLKNKSDKKILKLTKTNREEAQKVFQDFEKKKDKKIY